MESIRSVKRMPLLSRVRGNAIVTVLIWTVLTTYADGTVAKHYEEPEEPILLSR